MQIDSRTASFARPHQIISANPPRARRSKPPGLHTPTTYRTLCTLQHRIRETHIGHNYVSIKVFGIATNAEGRFPTEKRGKKWRVQLAEASENGLVSRSIGHTLITHSDRNIESRIMPILRRMSRSWEPVVRCTLGCGIVRSTGFLVDKCRIGFVIDFFVFESMGNFRM